MLLFQHFACALLVLSWSLMGCTHRFTTGRQSSEPILGESSFTPLLAYVHSKTDDYEQRSFHGIPFISTVDRVLIFFPSHSLPSISIEDVTSGSDSQLCVVGPFDARPRGLGNKKVVPCVPAILRCILPFTKSPLAIPNDNEKASRDHVSPGGHILQG